MRIMRTLALVSYPLCAAAVAVLSLMPVPPKVPIDLGFIDKIEHGIAYLVLGVLGASFFRGAGPARLRTAVASVVAGFALGAAIELIQPLVGRSRELADALVNLAGLLSGAALYLFACFRSRRLSLD